MYFEKKNLSKRSFSFICVSPAFYLYSGGNSGTVTDAQHVRHKPRWPIRVNFLVLEMLSLQVSMVIEQGDAWQVTGGLHDHRKQWIALVDILFMFRSFNHTFMKTFFRRRGVFILTDHSGFHRYILLICITTYKKSRNTILLFTFDPQGRNKTLKGIAIFKLSEIGRRTDVGGLLWWGY